MVRHLIREVVKFGHIDDYMAAASALNKAGAKIGMPIYRIYQSSWGTFNEVFSEAEYESTAEMDRLMAVFGQDPDCRVAFRDYLSHLVEGQVHDYLLRERPLP